MKKLSPSIEGLFFYRCMDLLSYKNYFWFEVDTEAIVDVVDNVESQLTYFFAFSSTQIDENEGLAVVNGNTSLCTSFPSALLNEPSRRNLNFGRADVIVRDGGIGRGQLLELLAAYDGILEETACIARYLGIGKFRLTDVDDGLSQLFRRQGCFGDTLALQLIANASIVEAWTEGCAKPKRDK